MSSAKHTITKKSPSSKKKVTTTPKGKQKQPSTPWLKLLFPSKWLKMEIIAVLVLMIAASLVYYYLPFTRMEVDDAALPYHISFIQDSSLELGQQQTRQNGINGTRETVTKVRHTLSGRILSRAVASQTTTKEPVDKTIAKGTKKYQYMWCSNGTYRYYTNEQFQNPNTGFTHQSTDYCAQTGNGIMSGLADTPPNPVYRQSSPTFTHCYDTGVYYTSIDCYSY